MSFQIDSILYLQSYLRENCKLISSLSVSWSNINNLHFRKEILLSKNRKCNYVTVYLRNYFDCTLFYIVNNHKTSLSDNIFYFLFVTGELKSKSLPRGFPPQIIVQRIDDEGKTELIILRS